MNVFVVLVDAMDGEQPIGTSPTHGEALERLSKVTFGANPRVREVPVLNAQPDPKMVYTAEYYERGLKSTISKESMETTRPQGVPSAKMA